MDNYVANENDVCARMVWCGGVDVAWEKKAKERQKKMEKHLAKKRK